MLVWVALSVLSWKSIASLSSPISHQWLAGVSEFSVSTVQGWPVDDSVGQRWFSQSQANHAEIIAKSSLSRMVQDLSYRTWPVLTKEL